MFKVATSIALSMAILFAANVHPEISHASSCSVSGGQSGRLKYSGQLNVLSATVCGDQIWKLLPKPKKPVKPIVRTTPAKPYKYVNRFTVVPDRPMISGKNNSLTDVPISFRALARRHIRNRMLFWYPSQVKFIPKTFLWSFGQGANATKRVTSHSWPKPGTYRVTLQVGYSVLYRIVGRSNWLSLAGLVFSTSPKFKVRVGQIPLKSLGNTVLVHWQCSQKPFAPGC